MRIRLRALEPEDLDLLYNIENDQSLWDVGNTNVPYSRYALHNYIAQTTGDIYQDGQVRLMIENEQSEVVGIADLVNFDARHQRAELGLVIINKFRRNGYAVEVVGQVADYALRVLHLHQLYAVVDVDNMASSSLFAHLGWQSSARLHEWLFDGKSYHDVIIYQKIL